MTKDKDRDDALIAEKKRLAEQLQIFAYGLGSSPSASMMLQAAANLRGDEPAKPVDDEEPMVPRDVAESWKARADNLKEDRENLLSDLAIMMSKHVENWPEPKRFSTAIALLDKILSEALGKSLPEPAKPDRYLQVWKEAKDAYIYPNRTEHESDQVAAAVLRKHFAPPREVVEAARAVRKWYSGLSNPRLLADFILKGDV